jgi:DNA-binding GntR family transcriptional regulator
MRSLKIARKSLQDEATDLLRAEIVHGRLAAGSTLTEIVLADRMGIGRGTVRSALFTLEADELVARLPYSSWHVAPLDAEVIWELYSLREALEQLAARIVVTRRAEAAPLLAAAFADLVAAQPGPLEARVAADLGYHRTLVEATAHGHLIRRYRALSHKLEWLYRWSEGQWPQREPLVGGHDALHRALMQGSEAEAVAAVAAHLADGLRQDLDGFHALAAQVEATPDR